MPTDGRARMTSWVCLRSPWMSAVCQTMRFGSGVTVPSSQSACPFLLTHQSFGPRYLPEITTCTGPAIGVAVSAWKAAAPGINEHESTIAARRPMRLWGRRMPIRSAVGRRRKRRHVRRPIVDAGEGQSRAPGGQPQGHREPAVLRQAVALDDFRAELRLGVDYVLLSLPARYLVGIALLGGNVTFQAGRVLIGRIAGRDREGVGADADSEVVALRNVGHQLVDARRAGRSCAHFITAAGSPCTLAFVCLPTLLAAPAPVHVLGPACLAPGTSGCPLLPSTHAAPLLLCLFAQLIDRLPQIIAAGRIEFPITGEMHAGRRFRGKPHRAT